MLMSTLAEIAIEILTFAVVVALSMSLLSRVVAQADVRRRLGQQVAGRAQPSAGLIKDTKVTNPFLLWVQRSTSLADTKDQAKLTRDLALAGVRHPAAPTFYVIARFSLACSNICRRIGCAVERAVMSASRRARTSTFR